MMSVFAERVAQSRRRSMRRWVRGLRYAGNMGAMLTGVAGAWVLLAVMLS